MHSTSNFDNPNQRAYSTHFYIFPANGVDIGFGSSTLGWYGDEDAGGVMLYAHKQRTAQI